jgi:hypothetical protein
MKSENPKIEWSSIAAKPCLKFTFNEMLTTEDAEVAVAEWKRAFQSKINGSIVLVWDCRKLKRYDSAAKAKWTETLKDLKSRIQTIWLISESPLIRMGASMLALATSIPVKPVSSESKILM